MAKQQSIYTVGGTVQAGGGIYIEREADKELLELCRVGELAFILSSRQVGKSSLMVRTAQELDKENIRSSIVDLNAIGVNVTLDEWYLGILNEIANTLELKTDIFAWWSKHAGLGPVQRLVNFFRDVLLKEVSERVVLFFDEIDTTLSIPFSDDFFAALRAIYNARSTTPDFSRLSFVLIGVATPSDLISDSKRTPFNIGRRVELRDFTIDEAKPLAIGLGENADKVLEWVFAWTNGHPYLTQFLCAHLAKNKGTITEEIVARAVEKLFLGEGTQQDNNLQFVRDMLTRRAPDVRKVLKTYRAVREGKLVLDEERSLAKAHLKISGVVRRENGRLIPRNPIYERAFDPSWIKENLPEARERPIIITFIILIFSLIVLLFYDLYWINQQLDRYRTDFYQASTPKERLGALAHIFNLHGILSTSKDYDIIAQDLFFSLQVTDQMDIFLGNYGEQNSAELYTVIKGLYITFAEVDDSDNSSKLLELMRDSLKSIDTPKAKLTRSEIIFWLDAKQEYKAGDFDLAIYKYSEAIDQNNQNPAILYERAKAYIAKRDYQRAISDLDEVVAIARSKAPKNQPMLLPTQGLELTNTSVPSLTQELPIQATTQPSMEVIPVSILPPLSIEILPASTPSPTPTTSPDFDSLNTSFKGKFSSISDIATAVRNLFEINPKLLAFIDASNIELPNLAYIGIKPTQYQIDLTTAPNLTSPSTGNCDRAQFIADVTGPDGTTYTPGATFQKTWRLRNIGTCTWTTSYALVFDSGTQMGAPNAVNFPISVAPGQTVDLSVDMTVPNRAGHYIGYWKLRNASGVIFGIGSTANRAFWVETNVGSASGMAYDFTANAASAVWTSGAGTLSFPGTEGDARGFGLKLDKPKFEGGVELAAPGLLMIPQNLADGYIQASYPPFHVQIGDRFQATTGCEFNATSCYVTYRIDYQIGSESVRTFWTFREHYEGWTYNVNLNLDSLAGNDVKFILYTSAYGSATGDRALWGNPIIARSGGLTATAVPTVTGTPPTATTPTPIPTIPASSCDKAQFIADVMVPDGTTFAPGVTFNKTWRLKNVGTCPWSTSYQLVFYGGEQMGGPSALILPKSVAPGQTVDLTVSLTAPNTAGSYRSYWMFKNASGALFGIGAQANKPWWLDIKVSGATSTVTKDPNIIFTPTP